MEKAIVDENILAEEFLSGTSVALLSKKYKSSERTLSRILYSKGINVKKIGHARGQAKTAAKSKGKAGTVKEYKISSNTSDIDIAYFAGIFDGEGTISRVSNSALVDGTNRWEMSIPQNGTALHEWLINKFGGKYYKINRDNNNFYTWKPSGQKSVYTLLKVMIPYLIVKKDSAEKAMKELEKRYEFK